MTSQGANLYKPNSSKIKLQNVYPYDSFRPGNINNEVQMRGKSSSPNTKFNMQKDILKSIKGNNFQQNFTSYNMGFKFNDVVIIIFSIYNVSY